MNKKIFIFLSIAIFVVAIVIAGGYYFYKNPIDNNYQNNNTSQKTDEPINGECEGDQCIVETNNIIDGVFQKTENSLLYFQPKDKDEVTSIKIADDAVFAEVTFSVSFENIGEKSISLTDFNNGDQISVVVRSNSSTEEEDVVGISRIIVKGAVVSADNPSIIQNKEIIDGVFQKIESGLLYFKSNDKDNIRSIKMVDGIIPIEITLSESFENVGEKSISLTDFNDGDSISVFIGFDDVNEEIVSKLLRIVVLGENN
ncbi:hypothetical protein KKH96_03425 [Patescibacteria group bacterium]|nr:hypothetical protein [Patescibacteria group bacterium]